MDGSEIFQLFERFGADAVLVALAVAVGVRILKRTLLKDKGGALLTALLPFALGIALFALLQGALCLFREYLEEDALDIVARGFAAGCLSTLFSAFLSRFKGGKALSVKESAVRELLTGLASGDALDALAVEVAACVSEEYSDEDVQRVEEALKAYAAGTSGEGTGDAETEGGTEEPPSDGELAALAQLIVQTLRTMAA